MDQDKFSYFCKSFEEAFQHIISDVMEFEFSPVEPPDQGGKRLSSIVGVVGMNKGRIHVEMSEKLAQKLFEVMNGEPPGDEMDLCFYLAEFTNMVTGKGITTLNNTYKGSELRLTPPAIFAGDNLDITTPKVQSTSVFYKTQHGNGRIDIGFEGV